MGSSRWPVRLSGASEMTAHKPSLIVVKKGELDTPSVNNFFFVAEYQLDITLVMYCERIGK